VTILVAAANYPHPGHAFSGIFNERSVAALHRQGFHVRVLSPRPYAPRALCQLVPRWQRYARIPGSETRDGVELARPAYPQPPVIGGSWSFEYGAYLASRRVVRRMHAAVPFDGILAFGLRDAGALAWRLARELGIVAAGWATGDDVRIGPGRPGSRALIRTLASLDLVFYQSGELLEQAAALLGTVPLAPPADRHIVLPRGVPVPAAPDGDVRRRIRADWGISNDAVLVLSIGRVVRDKGIFELARAIELAAAEEPRIVCRMIGAMPGFDDSAAVESVIADSPTLRRHMRLLPACAPAHVGELMSAADIFAFTSHHEGMPNSLLEAMSMSVPAVAFGIPPVRDIAGGTEALVVVNPFDVVTLARQLVRLSASPQDAARIGRIGRERVLDAFSLDRSMTRAMQEMSRVVTTRVYRRHPVVTPR
jgi:teichuronic acid biosynthesis glycosyltransferase TuaC